MINLSGGSFRSEKCTGPTVDRPVRDAPSAEVSHVRSEAIGSDSVAATSLAGTVVDGSAITYSKLNGRNAAYRRLKTRYTATSRSFSAATARFCAVRSFPIRPALRRRGVSMRFPMVCASRQRP